MPKRIIKAIGGLAPWKPSKSLPSYSEPTPETTQKLAIVEDVVSAFYVRLEVADRPGVLAQVAEVLGLQGCSIKQLYQHGLGDDARLVMTIHPVLESRLFAALRLIGRLDFTRTDPHAIRVIEEEYV